MHQSYEKRLKHRADFRVRYKFRLPKDGDEEKLPFQGFRCDFSYDEWDSHTYMIFPEFEDAQGSLILENDKRVLIEGTALMWIVNPEWRSTHQRKIKVGTRGFFRKGSPIADCEVIEIIDLFVNPVS